MAPAQWRRPAKTAIRVLKCGATAPHLREWRRNLAVSHWRQFKIDSDYANSRNIGHRRTQRAEQDYFTAAGDESAKRRRHIHIRAKRNNDSIAHVGIETAIDLADLAWRERPFERPSNYLLRHAILLITNNIDHSRATTQDAGGTR